MTTHTYWTTAPITQTTNSTVTTNSTTITASSAITTEAERGTPEPYITFGSNLIEVGNALFYIVVGAGSGVLILLLVILIMCMAVCCLVADKGKSYTITTAAMHTQQIQCGERDSRNPDRRWPQTQGMFNQIVQCNIAKSITACDCLTIYTFFGYRSKSDSAGGASFSAEYIRGSAPHFKFKAQHKWRRL